jgi:RNA polymerase sigma factor (TIGR02999 family)
MGDITQLIVRAQSGERPAIDALFEALYPELRRIAHARLARHQRDTLMDTTVLLHECYLKLLRAERLGATDRAHFIAYAATMMRSLIVDAARARHSERRGAGAVHLALDTELSEQLARELAEPAEQILDVDRALTELAALDPRLAQVVEMRYFAGMSEADVAVTLGVSDRTVRRDWEKARLLLAHALRAN